VRSQSAERVWTVAQGGFDRPVCGLKSLSRPQDAVYPIASLGERLSQSSQFSPPLVSRGGGRASAGLVPYLSVPVTPKRNGVSPGVPGSCGSAPTIGDQLATSNRLRRGRNSFLIRDGFAPASTSADVAGARSLPAGRLLRDRPRARRRRRLARALRRRRSRPTLVRMERLSGV
jgi:hypothetical protein